MWLELLNPVNHSHFHYRNVKKRLANVIGNARWLPEATKMKSELFQMESSQYAV